MSTNDNHKKAWTAPLLVALFTAVATLTGSYLAFKGTDKQVETSQLRIFIESQIAVNKDLLAEIQSLKTENADLQVRLFRTQLEMLEMEARLQDTTTSREVLQSYLEAMPIPAWIKVPNDKGIFVMMFINDEYTAAFGTTKKEYIGKTDFDVHPHKLALGYQAADEEVAITGKDVRYRSTVVSDGEVIAIEVVKFQIKLPNGTYGVGGMVVKIYPEHS